MARSKTVFCWTCGSHLNHTDFQINLNEQDGLHVECNRCDHARRVAARLDAQRQPREGVTIVDGSRYRLPGQGRNRQRRPLAERAAARLEDQLRSRP